MSRRELAAVPPRPPSFIPGMDDRRVLARRVGCPWGGGEACPIPIPSPMLGLFLISPQTSGGDPCHGGYNNNDGKPGERRPGREAYMGRGLFLSGTGAGEEVCRLQEGCLCSYLKGNSVPSVCLKYANSRDTCIPTSLISWDPAVSSVCFCFCCVLFGEEGTTM